MARTILHVDMNSCYASIEMALNPELRGKAVAVGGSRKTRHGIILAKSQEAKKYGVKTAEPIWKSLNKCPHLIIVPPHYNEYLKYSKMAKKIYYEYTNQVEPFGIDECWLDITNSLTIKGDAKSIAEEIRKRIKDELKITVSIGVSFNKIFAKLGSDMKKPDAITYIPLDGYRDKIWGLPVSDLLYVGYATTKKLNRFGISTIGDLARFPKDMLRSILGINGEVLWKYANGLDNSRVKPEEHSVNIKSIGNGTTCTRDLINNQDVYNVFLKLAQTISRRLIERDFSCNTIQISVKDNNFKVKQYQIGISYPTQSTFVLASEAMKLFNKHYDWKNNIRALGIRALKLTSSHSRVQIDMFNDYDKQDKLEKVDNTLYEIREKYGKNVITVATLMEDARVANNTDHMNTLPGMMYV